MNINYILFSLVIVKFMSCNLLAQPYVPTPPATTMAPAQTHAPIAVSANDKDFEEVNKNLTETVAIKKVLKDLVKDINDKLLDARKKVLSVQKLSFDVLQKTQAEAEPLIAQASADLQSLQALQSTVQADLVPKFENNVKQIEELIKKIQDKMNELQSKGLKFQMSQTQPSMNLQAQVGQHSANSPQPLPATAVVNQVAVPIPAANQSQGSQFYHSAWDWAIDKVSSAGSFIKSSWNQFKHWAFKSESDDVKKTLNQEMAPIN